MGQYWKPVNLDKKEYIHPHLLGCGLKLWEQVSSWGVGSALVILLAAQRGVRGGGDLDMPHDGAYAEIAAKIIGRWAGDRIAFVGDYAEDTDLPAEFDAGSIYGQTIDGGSYTDITALVAQVIEHEMDGKFTGDGWREFVEN
jgi:hypothetical protein